MKRLLLFIILMSGLSVFAAARVEIDIPQIAADNSFGAPTPFYLVPFPAGVTVQTTDTTNTRVMFGQYLCLPSGGGHHFTITPDEWGNNLDLTYYINGTPTSSIQIDLYLNGVLVDSGTDGTGAGSFSSTVTFDEFKLTNVNTASICLISAAFDPLPEIKTEPEEEPEEATLVLDNRINPGWGDLEVVIYPSLDDPGLPALDIYEVRGSIGVFIHRITQADVNIQPPAENLLIWQSDNVAFYALTSGEFQFNITEPSGNVISFVIDGIPQT